MTTSSTKPTLPPLYFADHSSQKLPAEVLHRCLVEYADWGDLARLASVQSKWSTIMYDAANQSLDAKRSLAEALLEGTNGLAANPTQAMKLLVELATSTQTAYAAPAMKRMALCYLTGSGVSQNTADIHDHGSVSLSQFGQGQPDHFNRSEEIDLHDLTQAFLTRSLESAQCSDASIVNQNIKSAKLFVSDMN